MNPARHIIDEARRWVNGWDFVEIAEISWRQNNEAGGLWYPPFGSERRARIALGWDESIGGLWHEVFHSVAHNAPLIKTNGEWCEGWCCAFSEVIRMNYTEVDKATKPQSHFQQYYQWPVVYLTDYVKRSSISLRELWLEWNARTTEPGEFSKFIGYNPTNGHS